MEGPAMRIISSFMLIAFVGTGCVSDDDNTDIASPPIGFIQTFGDEFEGVAGLEPDPELWVREVNTDVEGPLATRDFNELQYYTGRTENVELDGNGNLVIRAREEDPADRDDFDGRAYTSALIKTEGLFDQRFGRFEARIAIPRGTAFGAAFRLIGARGDVLWPVQGEINIMNHISVLRERVFGRASGPGFTGPYSYFRAYAERILEDDGTESDRDFTQTFHIYTLDWDPDRIVWSVDGVPFHRITRAASIAQSEVNCDNDDFLDSGNLLPLDCEDFEDAERWPFNEPMYLALSLPVGGNTTGNATPSDRDFPGEMVVDWVRVFRRADPTAD